MPARVWNSGVIELTEVVVNHTVYLRCPADGIPPPSIIWLRDDVPLVDLASDDLGGLNVRRLSSGRQLELRHVTRRDEAVYQCRATNVAGQQSKRFQLRVLGNFYPSIPFGWSGVGRGMGVLNRGGDRRRGKGSFGSEFGVFHCNQWGLCCVVFRERRALPKLIWEDLLSLHTEYVWDTKFIACYRAMHFSAKRGIAIVCRLSVCL